MGFLQCETVFNDKTFASSTTELIEHNKSERVGCIKFKFETERRDGEELKRTVNRLTAISIYLNGQKQVIILYLKGKSLVNNNNGKHTEYIYSEGDYPVACKILCNSISHDIEEVQIKVDFLQFMSELQRINQELLATVPII